MIWIIVMDQNNHPEENNLGKTFQLMSWNGSSRRQFGKTSNYFLVATTKSDFAKWKVFTKSIWWLTANGVMWAIIKYDVL